MELREMIETAAKACGDQKALATRLGIHSNHLSNAKAGQRGLPDEACAILAQVIAADFGAVIAARNRAVAKNEEDRAFWKKVAGFGFAAFISGTALPPEAQAGQDSMTVESGSMYIMSTTGRGARDYAGMKGNLGH